MRTLVVELIVPLPLDTYIEEWLKSQAGHILARLFNKLYVTSYALQVVNAPTPTGVEHDADDPTVVRFVIVEGIFPKVIYQGYAKAITSNTTLVSLEENLGNFSPYSYFVGFLGIPLVAGLLWFAIGVGNMPLLNAVLGGIFSFFYVFCAIWVMVCVGIRSDQSRIRGIFSGNFTSSALKK